MYYYIFEPPQGPKEYERTAQIKELLYSLGISGETTAPLPGRSVENLVELAIAKRYSTIIAVGSMNLINQVARALQSYEVVFGVIPTTEHPDITQLIGVSDWKSAAEQLKRRRIQLVRQGIINDEICFLTPAHLSLPPRCNFQLKTKEFSLKGRGRAITITPARLTEEQPKSHLLIEVEGTPLKSRGFFGLFSGRAATPTDSTFQVDALTISTDREAPVSLAGTILSHTPISFHSLDKPLKLIVSRGHTPLTLDVFPRQLV